jgi:ABC-type branched-subunit amino acid transport system substrate-binding protein
MSQAGDNTIKVGVPAPLSGSLASPGTDVVNGAKLAANEINSRGGVLGKQLEILAEDDACDAQQGVQAAEMLVNEGIVAIAGGFCSGAAIPQSDVLRRRGNLPYIAESSSNPKFTEQGYDNVFRLMPRDDVMGPNDAAYLMGIVKATKIAILNDNTTFSKGLADLVRAALPKERVVYFDAITPNEKDYTSTLTRVASYNPDILYYSGYYPEFALLIKQRRTLGLKFKLAGGGGTFAPELIGLAGSAAEDPDVTLSTPPLGDLVPGATQIREAYKAAYGKEPGFYAAYEYDAIQVLAQAIRNANSTNPENLNRALHAINGYQGVTGPISFDSKGDRGHFEYVEVTIRNGKFVIVAKTIQGKWVPQSQ